MLKSDQNKQVSCQRHGRYPFIVVHNEPLSYAEGYHSTKTTVFFSRYDLYTFSHRQVGSKYSMHAFFTVPVPVHVPVLVLVTTPVPVLDTVLSLSLSLAPSLSSSLSPSLSSGTVTRTGTKIGI